jgi:hypothetical protein
MEEKEGRGRGREGRKRGGDVEREGGIGKRC